MFKDFITKDEYKRTVSLLTRVRENYGIDTYLLMKNVLTVGIITEYYQNTYHLGIWIRYMALLSRNEMLYNMQNATIDGIMRVNFIQPQHISFFGIPRDIVVGKSFTNVIKAEHDFWITTLLKGNFLI